MNKNVESYSNVIRFKEILLELHRGAKPVSLFEQFHEVMISASDEEYNEIVKQMMAEGISGKRAKRWGKHMMRTRRSLMPADVN